LWLAGWNIRKYNIGSLIDVDSDRLNDMVKPRSPSVEPPAIKREPTPYEKRLYKVLDKL
jgi:hypothetical protein